MKTAGGQVATMLGIRHPYDLSIVAVVAEQQKHAMQGGGAPCIQTCKAEAAIETGAKSIGHISKICYSV